MNTHLSDDEIAMVVAGLDLAPGRAHHLAGCATCRTEVEQFSGLTARRREVMKAEAPDWGQQRRRIMEQLDRPAAPVVALRRHRLWRPLLAAAAAAVAVVGLWFQMSRHRPVPTTRTLPVEQILNDVDATLADQSVPGFESLDSLLPTPEEMASMTAHTNTAS